MPSPSAPPKRDCRTTVLANEPLAEGFYRMTVHLPGADALFRPGQFFQLRLHPESLDPLLRRPFAPSAVDGESLRFVYAVVGRGTREMTALVPGDPVAVLCPLGRPYDLPEDASTPCLLVGGGCGSPSLLPLARSLRARGHAVDVALGASTACSLLELDAFRECCRVVEIATDDGTFGLHGHAVAAAERVLDALGEGVAPRLYACGPDPMLRGLAQLSRRRALACQVSLEARMACGFGACIGCVVKVRESESPDGFVYRKVCQDGPVFDADSLLWE